MLGRENLYNYIENRLGHGKADLATMIGTPGESSSPREF
jgi:hypothetical protein